MMKAPSASAAAILDVLPQTQCQRCGYPDCAAYAQAIAEESAPINQCPPGGEAGVARLAQLTGRAHLALNPSFGQEQERTVAYIDENWCIGCTLCIKACPVDAIIGVNKAMHTVLEDRCTGCELCIPACPVDCIEIEIATPGQSAWQAWSQEQADLARAQYHARQTRHLQQQEVQRERQISSLAQKSANLAAHSTISDPAILERKSTLVAQALVQAQSLKNQ